MSLVSLKINTNITFNASTTIPTTPGIFIGTTAMIDILHDFFLCLSLINLMVNMYHVYLLFFLLVTTAYTTTTITATTKAINIIKCCKGKKKKKKI